MTVRSQQDALGCYCVRQQRIGLADDEGGDSLSYRRDPCRVTLTHETDGGASMAMCPLIANNERKQEPVLMESSATYLTKQRDKRPHFPSILSEKPGGAA